MAKQLTEQEKREIRKLYLEGKSTKELAKQFGRARSTISQIIKAASIQIRNRHEALELSETWQERKETKRFGVNARTETPEQARRREVKEMSKRRLKADRTKMSDLPLFEAGAKERKRICARESFKQKYQHDPQFRLKEIYRRRFRKIVEGRYSGSMINFMGCEPEEFRQWIESKWEDWMNWNNYGPVKKGCWQIDHAVPCSWFDHSSNKELSLCWNYQNLRPLCAVQNNLQKNSGVDSMDYVESLKPSAIKSGLIEIIVRNRQVVD